jgi:hypothetical protein
MIFDANIYFSIFSSGNKKPRNTLAESESLTKNNEDNLLRENLQGNDIDDTKL